MLISDTYRILLPDEKILETDQFKLSWMSDEWWVPVELFAGRRVRELDGQNVLFRRLIMHEVQP